MDLDSRAPAGRADAAAVGGARFIAANAAVPLVVLAAEGFSRIGLWLAVSGR